MKRFWADMNPTVRGFLVIGAIALTVVVLNLYNVLASLAILVQIAFLLAITFFVFLVWRERREEISAWPMRAQALCRRDRWALERRSGWRSSGSFRVVELVRQPRMADHRSRSPNMRGAGGSSRGENAGDAGRQQLLPTPASTKY